MCIRDRHKAGGLMFIQLWHVGRISHPRLQPDHMPPVAPSPVKPEGQAFIENERGEGQLVPFVTPRALQLEEMPYIVEQLSLIHISEPTRLLSISYAVFCLK